jgi:tetratricopeptide (TPR) repeat protein
MYFSLPILSKEEKQAQKLVQHGKVDQALGLYQRVRNHSPHLLNTMGHLYGNRKGDYNSAVKYYKQAMKIQEKVYRLILTVSKFEKIVSFCIERRRYHRNVNSTWYCSS